MRRNGKPAGQGGHQSDNGAGEQPSLVNATPDNHRRQLLRLPDGRPVGSIGGSTFYKSVKEKHVLHIPPAFCSDVAVLVELERRGVRWVVLNLWDGRRLKAAVCDFWGQDSFAVNRGAGVQRGLRLEAWQPLDAPVQPALFDVEAVG